MNAYDAAEQAYKRGYEAGKRDAEAVIPIDVVKGYLLGLIDKWNGLGDRKYELPNMQVYNHIRKELDDLEEYIHKHFPNGDCT